MDEIPNFELKSYAYHFYFHDGLFHYITHLQEIIESVDDSKIQDFISKSKGDLKLNPSYESFIEEERFGDIFPEIFWKSNFLYTYAVLESSLDQICLNIKLAEEYKIELQDISGTGIRRAALYLQKVANLKAPFQTSTWQKLLDIGKLRNIFIHADGNTEITNIKIMTLSKKFPGVQAFKSFDGNYISLSLSKDFILDVISTIHMFFTDIKTGLKNSHR